MADLCVSEFRDLYDLVDRAITCKEGYFNNWECSDPAFDHVPSFYWPYQYLSIHFDDTVQDFISGTFDLNVGDRVATIGYDDEYYIVKQKILEANPSIGLPLLITDSGCGGTGKTWMIEILSFTGANIDISLSPNNN